MEKFEFASQPYVQELRRQLEDALKDSDLAGLEFTMSEEYTNAPGHLCGPDSGSIGFHFKISGGCVEVEACPRDDADVSIIADYQSVLPFVRLEQGRDPVQDQATQDAAAQLMRQGKLVVKGDMAARPAVVQQAHLHNRMAIRTL